MNNTGDDRRAGGPRLLGGLLPALTRPAFRKRSPAGAHIMADWITLVGPALAAVTVPQRLAQGTLTISCAGPVAMELSHLAPQLLAGINAKLGRQAVLRLRFVQDRPPLRSERRPLGGGQPPPAVTRALGEIESEPVRVALAKLAAAVYRSRG